MAHVTVDRDIETGVLRFTVTGLAEVRDIVPHIISEYPKHPGAPILWDFSRGLFSCASIDELKQLSSIAQEFGACRAGACTAIALQHRADEVQMKYYVELTKLKLPETRYAVFDDCGKADIWLLAMPHGAAYPSAAMVAA